MTERMNVGIVGAVTRGSRFAKSLGLTDFFCSHALCDSDEEGLEVPDSRKRETNAGNVRSSTTA